MRRSSAEDGDGRKKIIESELQMAFVG